MSKHKISFNDSRVIASKVNYGQNVRALHSTEKYFNKSCIVSKIYYHTTFQDPTSILYNGTSVTPHLEVVAVTILFDIGN
jgi:hypothetical protein